MTSTEKIILAGDIGGTNARFGCLSRNSNKGWTVDNFKKFKASDYPSFEAVLEAYLSEITTKPIQAALAAAGPIEDGYINLTNTDWQISATRIKEVHGFDRCKLFNDFVGMTRSIPELTDEDFMTIRNGKARENEPILVAGPGTGFGVGYLIPTHKGWYVMPTEGGHIAYSPQSSLEMDVLQTLGRDRDFVSLELVASGSGLPIVHKAVCDTHGKPYKKLNPAQLRVLAEAGDPIAVDVCNIRACATMGAIGDLALSGGARGGIVLAGGVSERMINFFQQPLAMSRYLHRGTRSDYVRDIPIRLLKSDLAPLIGAAASLEDHR